MPNPNASVLAGKVMDEYRTAFPSLEVRNILEVHSTPGEPPIQVVEAELDGERHNIVIATGRHERPDAALETIRRLRALGRCIKNPHLVFCAPFVGASVADICRREQVGYLDSDGYHRLDLANLSTGRRSLEKERRSSPRLCYARKSERVLRVLLTVPRREWRLRELADEIDVSVPLVYQAKRALAARRWLDPASDGIRLRERRSLLEEWAREYRYERNRAHDYRSPCSNAEIEELVVREGEGRSIRVALTGFSAAARLAPTVRCRRAMIYCEKDAGSIAREIGLRPTSGGALVTLIEPYDEGVFYGLERRDGMPLVSAVQTHLDLAKQEPPGEEAARTIVEEVIEPGW
jgi:hypothetical protein